MDPRAVHDPYSSWLRMRIWRDGRIVDERWIDSLAPGAHEVRDAIAARHSAIARLASDARQSWAVEMYDPARPPERAFLRFGSDDPPEKIVEILTGYRDPTMWHGGEVA